MIINDVLLYWLINLNRSFIKTENGKRLYLIWEDVIDFEGTKDKTKSTNVNLPFNTMAPLSLVRLHLPYSHVQ